LVIQKPLSHVLWAVGLVGSKTEGQRLINAGGAYIGANADARGGMDDALSFTPAKTAAWEELEKFVIDGKILILRVGKWRLKIIDIIPDEEYEEAGLTCQAWEALKEARNVEQKGDDAEEPVKEEIEQKAP
jgi:tyrosyl-tRNA synthetase